MIIDSLKSLAVPIDSLQGLPGNPRRGDVDAVATSLSRFGQRKPIVVRRDDGTIIAGNHTWQAAKKLGWSEIAVAYVGDDDVTAQAYALADNRTAELGSTTMTSY
jgi:ParB-like chromosome segregation protein Spo0J